MSAGGSGGGLMVVRSCWIVGVIFFGFDDITYAFDITYICRGIPILL